MEKKILITGLILLCVSANALASTPFSKTVRNDGVEINKCVDDFGKIDYCTVYDKNHAEELVKYSHKYSIAEEVIIQNTNSKQPARTFGENCMNVQYGISTGMTLFNSIFGAIDTIRRY